MPKLMGMDVSDEVLALNQHHAQPERMPKTDARKALERIVRERLENKFDDIWQRLGGDPSFWTHQYKFDTERGWHLDRYNKRWRIGVEIHGGQYMRKSGHSNASGQQRDWEKVNRCHECQIRLWGFTTAMVNEDHIGRLLQHARDLESTIWVG